ncbi:hypothetical protein [Lacisediminihabitans changchengi]|uniref:Uncharacterized protein n=1 Tax=Lacisediminihabitans changchengi TaxID=2787634 RepID=A0A934W3V7_9MICO|nr:hypothetical protein [Lacisediminihabitans changchengi]MBK4347644.1 hypothetical protein [Lacisediminihabitans changchengi]
MEQTATRGDDRDRGGEQQVATNGAIRPDSAPVSVALLGLVAPAAQRGHSAVDVVALVVAIVLAPVGFIIGVVAAILSFRKRRYVNGLAKAAIAVSLVLSVLGGAGAVVGGSYLQHQAHENALRASSAAMCSALATRPGVLTDAAFGWPAVGSTIPAYVTAVSDYESWWTAVAKVAPAKMADAVAKIVTTAHTSAERITASRVVDHDRDYADMRAVAASSPLSAWTATYCG